MEIVGPKINTAFTFYLPLVTSGSDDFKATPTIAAGDCQVSIDGGATWANPATLPSETAASSKIVKFPLAAGEMNAALVIVRMIDQTATKEWKDTTVFIRTSTNGFDEATKALQPTTAGRTLDVAANGGLDSDTWANLLATTVDSVALNLIFKMLLALEAGKATVTDNGTTRTIIYQDQAGTGTVLTVTVRESDGGRTGTATPV